MSEGEAGKRNKMMNNTKTKINKKNINIGGEGKKKRKEIVHKE